jgi:predicted nucleic acid-binding protein
LSLGYPIFADAAFWIALTNRRDQYHSHALLWSRYLAAAAVNIVTTEGVLWEWMNAFAATSTRGIAVEGYRRRHQDPQVRVVAFSADLIESSVRLYETRSDKSWSLTDCCSFVVMEQHGIRLALTTDHHFEQVGATAVLLQPPAESGTESLNS